MGQKGNHREVRKYIIMKENTNITHQNLWQADKTRLRKKFIAVNTYLKKEESFQTSNLTFHIKKVGKGAN